MIFSPKRLFACTVTLALLTSPFAHRLYAADPIEPVDPVRRQIDEAVARVKPALVRIKVVATQYYQGREVKFEGSGSGVIISKEGYVITNHHVAGTPPASSSSSPATRRSPPTCVGTDPLADISVLKLKPDAQTRVPHRRTLAIRTRCASAIRSWPWVARWPCRNPSRSASSATSKWSCRKRSPPRGSRSTAKTSARSSAGSATTPTFIPGNSGGPLVNLKGQVIGINEISFGLSGAIPGNLAQRVARQIIDKGKVSRSWLGVEIQPLLKEDKVNQRRVSSGTWWMISLPPKRACIRATSS